MLFVLLWPFNRHIFFYLTFYSRHFFSFSLCWLVCYTYSIWTTMYFSFKSILPLHSDGNVSLLRKRLLFCSKKNTFTGSLSVNRTDCPCCRLLSALACLESGRTRNHSYACCLWSFFWGIYFHAVRLIYYHHGFSLLHSACSQDNQTLSAVKRNSGFFYTPYL